MSVNKKSSKKFYLFLFILFLIIFAIGSYAAGIYAGRSKYKKELDKNEISTVAESVQNTNTKEDIGPDEGETSISAVESEESSDEADSKKIETWGPDRIVYSWDVRADHPTFNSIYNDPVMGDERNFVRIRKANSDEKFTDNVMAEPGEEYEVQIFFP